VSEEDPAARIEHALLLHRNGRGLEAAPYLDGPLAPEIHYRLGLASHQARDFSAAVDHLDRALAAEPGHLSAQRLLPGACYRAGRLDHRALAATRRGMAEKFSFATRLRGIARAVGAEGASDDGLLPDRTGWTDRQRFDWGRRIDGQIRLQALSGPDMLADLQGHTQQATLPLHLGEGGAIILLLHVGSINLAIAQIIASGINYRHVTNSIDYGLAFPDRVIDIHRGHPSTLLARMGAALRGRACLLVAADGPWGQRVEVFRHRGVEYPIAAGPLVLASG
jgi:hypothetical protein